MAKTFTKLFAALAMILIMAGCSKSWNADRAKELVDAYQAGTITDSDYSEAVDMCEFIWEKEKPLLERISKEADIEAQEEILAFSSTYPNSFELADMVLQAYKFNKLPADLRPAVRKILDELSEIGGAPVEII